MLRSSVAPLTVFPANSVSRGRASAIPVRLQTSAGLATLFDKLQEEDLSATAVVFDFDKVLANVPAACVDARDPSLVRGGLHTIRVLEMLRARGVPLFIATARASPMLLQDLVAKLGGVGAHPLLGFFAASAVGSAPVTAANGGIGEAAAAAAAENIIGTSVLVQEIRNESLRVKIRRVVDTNIFSAGYEKAKLIAHLIAHEIGPERRRVIFVDDNVFHAYFVLQEAPIHIHTQQPQRHCTVVSSWWDPSEEQSRGQMRVINDSDFSYTQAYQECLSAFGVDEPERIRTAGILLAKALLRGES